MSKGRVFLVAFALLVSSVRAPDAQPSERPIGILLAVGDIASCRRDPTEPYPDSYRWAFLPTKPNEASFKIMRDVRADKCNRA